jgi:hypothetical protein
MDWPLIRPSLLRADIPNMDPVPAPEKSVSGKYEAPGLKQVPGYGMHKTTSAWF